MGGLGAGLFLCAWIAMSAPFSGWSMGPGEAQMRLGRYVALFFIAATQAPVLAAIGLSATGLGWMVRKAVTADAPLALPAQAAVGMAVLLVLNWVVAWLGWLNSLTAWLLVAAGAAGVVWQFLDQGERTRLKARFSLPPTLLLFTPALGLMLVAVSCPPTTLWKVEAFGYDVTSYHLQLPREWMAIGRLCGLEHNVYSFLPSLGEGGYLLVNWLLGSTYAGIYTAQYLHAAMALLAAANIAALAAKWMPPRLAPAIGAIFLSVPWVMITGTLAYDEMFSLAFAAAALLVVMESEVGGWRLGVVVGVLTGAATMAKLTAGPMLAVPIGAVLLLNLRRRRGEDGAVRGAADATAEWAGPPPVLPPSSRVAAFVTIGIVGLVVLLPHFIRNGMQTENPVFPFATAALGSGHWGEYESRRWSSSHVVEASAATRLAALGEHWIFNAGYGSIGGVSRKHESGAIEARNIARFDRQWGFPLFWFLVAVAAAVAIAGRSSRRAGGGLLFMMIVQIVVWLAMTHLQARFLVWTVLPGSLMIALGGGVAARGLRSRPWIVWAVLTTAALLLAGSSCAILWRQTIQRVPPWQIVDTLPPEETLDELNMGDAFAGDHPLNHLPPHSRTMLVADASRMLYIRSPAVYHSAFDPSPLGQLYRRMGDRPQDVLAALRSAGITHLWVHWSELQRLMATYGYDPDVTPERLEALAEAGLTSIMEMPATDQRPPGTLPLVTLYAIRPGPSAPVVPVGPSADPAVSPARP
jgi:hypothetical protein